MYSSKLKYFTDMEIKLQQSMILTCILGLMTFHGAFSSTRFNDSYEFYGLLFEYNVTEECYDLSSHTQNRAGSIKTDDYIIVYNSSSCQFGLPSYKMDPGDYPDLRKVAHRYEKVFDDNIVSVRKCSDSYGEPQTSVRFYTEPGFTGGILLAYLSIKENITIPETFQSVGSLQLPV